MLEKTGLAALGDWKDSSASAPSNMRLPLMNGQCICTVLIVPPYRPARRSASIRGKPTGSSIRAAMALAARLAGNAARAMQATSRSLRGRLPAFIRLTAETGFISVCHGQLAPRCGQRQPSCSNGMGLGWLLPLSSFNPCYASRIYAIGLQKGHAQWEAFRRRSPIECRASKPLGRPERCAYPCLILNLEIPHAHQHS